MGRYLQFWICSDLTVCALVRKLPISYKKFFLAKLGTVYLLAVPLSLAALILSIIIFAVPIDPLVWLIPEIITAIVSMTVFDVLRQSSCKLLMVTFVPQLSVGGILLRMAIMAIPILVLSLLPGMGGHILATFLSLGQGVLAFLMAAGSLKMVERGL